MTIEIQRDSCPFCYATHVQPWFTKPVDNQSFKIASCMTCGSAMVLPRPSQQEMDDYYQTHSYGEPTLESALALDKSHFPDSSEDAKRVIKRLKALAPGKRFMDIGAGVGFFSREARAQGFEVTAFEPNPNSASGFQQLVGEPPLQMLLSGNEVNHYVSGQDAVLLSQVLEHICDVDDMLDTISKVLVSGGIAAIAVPYFGSILSRLQGKKDMYISPPEHVNYFSMAGLDALFERYGFEKVESTTVTKVPRKRIGVLPWQLVYGILKVSEYVGKGMIINAYYRKR